MPEKSEGELDLSNLDALLSDLEKDLEAPATPGAASQPAATPPPEAAPPLEAAPSVAPPEIPDEELLAAPIPPGHRDEGVDELEEMFTEEDEPAIPAAVLEDEVEEVAEEPAAPAPVAAAVPPAPPKPEPVPVPSGELAFEDALELDDDAALSLPPPALPPPPLGAPPSMAPPGAGAAPSLAPPSLPPPLKPGVLPESLTEPQMAPSPRESPVPPALSVTPVETPTAALFMRFLKEKDYDRAAEIGLKLRTTGSTAVFRQNLAGVLFYAGRTEEAEQELVSLLEEFPYTISARRNLEIVRAK
ncbi:hypothetical protein HY522_09930 [bacterium]|nr:hypothetical protein [bacterium]